MSKINNSNYNKISVKTDSMVKMIEQLSKLGVFKEKRKSRAKKTSVPGDEIKQDSDMVGYVKTLAGQAGRGDPNLFSLRQVEPGMSQQQIRDITERNNAGVAALRAEVQQQRSEDLQRTFEPLTRLANLASERFRGAQEPGAGQRVDPFAQSSTILLPDIQEGEEAFTQTLNEGGPRAEPQVQTELFAEDEDEEEFVLPIRPQLQPREKISGEGRASRGISTQGLQQISNELGLGKIPKRSDMENLSYQTALKIYKKDYWDAQNLSLLCDQSVANIIYDGCVNQGIDGMSEVIRSSAKELGVDIKGQIYTDVNIKKLNSLNQQKLFDSIKKFREMRYKEAATWGIHGEGWMNRLSGIEYQTNNQA
jgi:hypothetical protein